MVMPTPRADVHDFDFLKGIWSVANRRLKVRWKESHDWDEFPGTHFGHADHLGGIVNVDEMAFPSKGFSGWSVRIFDLEQRRWAIYWVDSRSGTLFPPVFGGFQGDRGEFYGDDHDDGRPVKVQFLWTRLAPDAASWEQSFSLDGKVWEKNWVMRFTRIA